MTTRINLQTVKAAKPQSKRYVIWDAAVKGFGLRVSPEGRKTYILKTRFKGRQVYVTLGEHGSPLTPDTARDKALVALGQAKGGIDPVAAKRASDHADKTVKDLCDEYLADAEAGRVLTKFNATKSSGTLASDKGRIHRHIIPLIGRKKVQEVNKADVERLLRDVAAGKTAMLEPSPNKHGRILVKGGRGTASRTIGLLGGIFTYAISKGYCSDNPVHGVQKYKDAKKERFLSPEELKALGSALTKAEAEEKDLYAIAAIRFLILSGCRKAEALNLRWVDVDRTHSCLRLPDSKTGPKVVPLGLAALQLLNDLPRVKDNPFVFPGHVAGRPFVGLPRFFKALCKDAKISNLRIHDLRHSFASVGVTGHLGLPLIGALLGHKDAKTTARYAHLADTPVKSAANQVSKSIKTLLDGRVKGGRRAART